MLLRDQENEFHALVSDIYRGDFVSPDAMASRLLVDKVQLATIAGLPRDSISKSARVNARATQRRLRDVSDVLLQVYRWTGSMPQALAWYRAQPLPSFGDRTAESLVKAGEADALRAYLQRIAEGGYA
jgi:hypothetical protein